jgi:ParB/RepB/Spo0J family partition protein
VLSVAHNLIDIPVSQLRISPFNARKIRPHKRIEKVAESLKENGQKDPFYVYPGINDDTGYYMVLGGETRWRAALIVGLVTLSAFVDRCVDPTDELALTKISHILNDSIDECDLDRGLTAIQLSDAGHTYEKIAAVLGITSRSHIVPLIRLASLPKRFIDLGQDFPERFSASLGDLIHQAIEKYDEDFALELLKKALYENFPHKKIEKAIKIGPAVIMGDDDKQRRRIRRIGGMDIKLSDSPGGRYDSCDAKTPGYKVLKFQVELTDAQAKKLDKWLYESFAKLVDDKEEGK